MNNILGNAKDFFKGNFYNIQRNQELIMLQQGRILTELLMNKKEIRCLSDTEFRIFSQWGEDGIIQWLIHKIPIKNETFIEFGVQNYTESNTRFLLMNNNWSGMIIDGNKKDIEYIKQDELYWRYDVTAVNAFITKDNINTLLLSSKFNEDLGILSIDIDGNDYWILEKIHTYNPRILICEYNAAFGLEKKISVPYRDDFERTRAHFSNLYFGMSLRALCDLAEQKGYIFIGTNSNANNAFFIRKDLKQYIFCNEFEVKEYNEKARQSRDKFGNLTYISDEILKLKEIENKTVINIENGEAITIKKLYEL